jgi:hypothetical protein
VYVGKLLQRYPAGRRLWQLLLGEEEDQPVGQVVWSDVCSDEDEKVRGTSYLSYIGCPDCREQQLSRCTGAGGDNGIAKR